MCEVGTLKELNVKPGDVVEEVGNGGKYTVTKNMYIGVCPVAHAVNTFRIISRASDNPKLWRDMTDAEKGALLLAHHDGKVIENKSKYNNWIATTPYWCGDYAYRVRTEPKVDVVTMNAHYHPANGWQANPKCASASHRITFNTIDGKPDTASIKMEAI